MEPPTPGPTVTLTGRDLVLRLPGLAWRYRTGCLKVLGLQFLLLLMGLSSLGATGLGIDYIRQQVAPAALPPHDFIMALPHGYETALAIARAFLLEAAGVLPDNPTAAADADTEQEILTAMDNARRGRTTFRIAHGLSTVRHAHRVLVLDGGRIVENGTHTQLLTQRGLYSRLYRQFIRVGLGGWSAARQPATG